MERVSIFGLRMEQMCRKVHLLVRMHQMKTSSEKDRSSLLLTFMPSVHGLKMALLRDVGQAPSEHTGSGMLMPVKEESDGLELFSPLPDGWEAGCFCLQSEDFHVSSHLLPPWFSNFSAWREVAGAATDISGELKYPWPRIMKFIVLKLYFGLWFPDLFIRKQLSQNS